MGIHEDIKRMKGEGKNEKEIIESLRKQKVSDKEISDALVQVKIKEAVSAQNTESNAPLPAQESELNKVLLPPLPKQKTFTAAEKPEVAKKEFLTNEQDLSQNNEGLKYSVSAISSGDSTQFYPGQEQTQQEYAPQEQIPEHTQQQEGYVGYEGQHAEGYTPQQEYPTEAYSTEAYTQYQPYQQAMSSDLITEISEQVVSEKLSQIQDKLERAVNFRTVAEARISSLNERLKRIEKIIDKLQLSLLQKVGEYVTDVEDLKQELEETQKSFKALAPERRHLTHHVHSSSAHEHAHSHAHHSSGKEHKHHP